MEIFQSHISNTDRFILTNTTPSFSIYRTPFDPNQGAKLNERASYSKQPNSELFLHILYMKSDEKTLTRNFNAEQLELFCHNRFYGPLVVAFNNARAPYEMVSFGLNDLETIRDINLNF